MTPKSKERVALFPGSFNPFTVGHESIVRRALQIADRVVVARGVNACKQPEDAAFAVPHLDDPRVEFTTYNGLTGEFARRIGADFIIRGIRSVKDYEYELQLADANRALFGIETVLLPALPELAWVSSSALRDLQCHGMDISRFLP